MPIMTVTQFKLFTVLMMMWAQIKEKDTNIKINNSLEYSHIIPCTWPSHTINKHAIS